MALSKVVKIDGKEYFFELSSAANQRVITMTKISLPNCVSDISGTQTKEEKMAALKGFYDLMDDFDRLPFIARAMLLPQLEKNSISEERFHELFNGPVAEACGHAITQALIDFFRQTDARKRLLAGAVEMQQKMAATQDKLTERVMTAMSKEADRMEATISGEKGQAAVDEMIQKILKSSSTTLPESLASILVPSRSEA